MIDDGVATITMSSPILLPMNDIDTGDVMPHDAIMIRLSRRVGDDTTSNTFSSSNSNSSLSTFIDSSGSIW